MTDMPAEKPAEDPAQKPPAESLTREQVEALMSDGHLVSEATHRHLEEVLKPSLLPTPNSGDDLTPEPEGDDFPSTGHSAHP